MTTTDILDLAIDSRFESGSQPNSTTWRASSIGYCMRGQMLERLGVPKRRIRPVKEKRTLEWGNAVHDYVKGLFREAGVLVEPKEPMNLCPGCRPDEWHIEDAELSASCHLDALLCTPPGRVTDGDSRLAQLRYQILSSDSEALQPHAWVTEIKGLKSSAMVRMVREAKVKGPEHLFQEHHLYQLGTQALLVRRNPQVLPLVPERFEILAAGKDSWGYLAMDLPEKWVKKAEDWIGQLNQSWVEQTLPPCSCSGWKSRYCAFPTEDGKSCCNPALVDAA